MSYIEGRTERLNGFLAGLLRYGTWLACALIGCGLLLDALKPSVSKSGLSLYASKLVLAGVGLMIILPISRVFTTFVYFVYKRDFVYSMFALIVLLIIAFGAFVK